LTLAQISHSLEIPVRLVRSPLLHDLIGAGLVTETVAEKGHDIAFQPGEPWRTSPVKVAIDAYEQAWRRAGALETSSTEEEGILTHLQRRLSDLSRSPDNVALKEI